MTKVDIFSGFLGAGKTTLIKKLISDGYNGCKLVLIENEFGQIGIDGGFLKESGINITEMNSGCICCSLVGDFGTALQDVINQFAPDRILIEPSGVGKLSDVVAAVKRVEGTEICGTVTVIDASKCRIYLKNFKEFYENQIKYAGTIILSRTGNISQEKLDQAIELIRAITHRSSQHLGTTSPEFRSSRLSKSLLRQQTWLQLFSKLSSTSSSTLTIIMSTARTATVKSAAATITTMTTTMMKMSTSTTTITTMTTMTMSMNMSITITTTTMMMMMTTSTSTIITTTTTVMNLITITLMRYSTPSVSRHQRSSQRLTSRMP